MTTEEKIKKVQFQCNVVNQIIPKIDKYFIDYCKALKEIWKEKLDKKRDLDILASYGLGTFTEPDNFSFGNNKNVYKFNWDYEIQELNKLYKQCIK